MDRLVIGDVGYGKTEIAIRAAFKAVTAGKQVAILVPTTILAQQHWLTFRERLADFPVQVEVLSRFRTAKEQKDVVQRLAKGQVDVVIGTHRLLSKDVRFRDLGLVVIDEEHRFGVAQKERLRQLTRTVDVLAMTATPIPRTLNLSLAGARDMSVIETPPRDRLPVHTEVCEADDELVYAFDLPGIPKEDVTIEYDDGMLTVTARRERTTKQGDDRFYRFERRFGSFTRSVGLPQGVDESKIRAEFQDGVLEIHVAKPEEVKPRRIEIGEAQPTIEGNATESA